MSQSFGRKPRTVLRNAPNFGSALSIRRELRDAMPAALIGIKEPAKVIAFRIDATPRAVEALRQGEHIPSLPVAIALARQYPQFKALLHQLMDAQTGDSGEHPARVIDEIERLLIALREQTR